MKHVFLKKALLLVIPLGWHIKCQISWRAIRPKKSALFVCTQEGQAILRERLQRSQRWFCWLNHIKQITAVLWIESDEMAHSTAVRQLPRLPEQTFHNERAATNSTRADFISADFNNAFIILEFQVQCLWVFIHILSTLQYYCWDSNMPIRLALHLSLRAWQNNHVPL